MNTARNPSGFSDLYIRHAGEPGWGLAPAHAVIVTGVGTVQRIQPWYAKDHLHPHPLPEDFKDAMRNGTTNYRVSAARIQNLVETFLDAGFFDLQVPEDHGMVMDVGWNELVFRLGGRERTLGYSGAENWKIFHRLCSRVDGLAGIQHGNRA
jgi:hypothetical protein